MQERRQQQESVNISEELHSRGRQQLLDEIAIIESWLQDLKETRDDNPETIAARLAYTDMLQSRKDLLNTLDAVKSGSPNA